MKQVRILQIVTIFCAAAAMILVWLYFVTYSAGHTAADPRRVSIPFVAVMVVGILTWFSTAHRSLVVAAAVLGICGIGLGFFIHTMGIVTQYDHWIAAGMPDQNPKTFALMTGYMSASFLFALAVPQLLRRLPQNEQAQAEDRRIN